MVPILMKVSPQYLNYYKEINARSSRVAFIYCRISGSRILKWIHSIRKDHGQILIESAQQSFILKVSQPHLTFGYRTF